MPPIDYENMTPEERQILMQYLIAIALGSSSTPSTGVNLSQDLIGQIFSPDAALLTGQLGSRYHIFPEFDPSGLTETTDSFIAGGDPVWSTVAQGIKEGVYDKASAESYLMKEIKDIDITPQRISEFVDEMFAERAALEQAKVQYQKDRQAYESTNIFGEANLPQQTDVWSLDGGPGTVVVPPSQVSGREIDFVQKMQKEIEDSGLETFLAGKPEATQARMVALAQEAVRQKGLLREEDRMRAMRTSRDGEGDSEYRSPAELQAQEEDNARLSGATIASSAAANPPTGPGAKTRTPAKSTKERDEINYSEVPLAVKMLANLNLNPRQDDPNQLGASFGAAQPDFRELASDPAVAAILAQATGDINRRYQPQESKLRSMKIRQAETLRNLNTFRNADLLNMQKTGLSPLDVATSEKISTFSPFMSAIMSYFGTGR